MAHHPYGRMPSTLNEQQRAATVAVQNLHMTAPPRNASFEKYKNILAGLGYAELTLGVTSCLMGAAAIIVSHTSRDYGYYWYPFGLSDSAQGIWCGAFLVVSGILGIKAARNPSRCMYNSNLILSILTSCAMGVLIIMSSMAAAFIGNIVGIIQGINAAVGFAGMIVCIVHSAYCCAGICCMPNRYQAVMMDAPQQCLGFQWPQQMIQLPNGQFAMVPPQGVTFPGYPHSNADVISPPSLGAPTVYGQGMQAGPNQLPSALTGAPTFAEPPKTQGGNPDGYPGNPPEYVEIPQ